MDSLRDPENGVSYFLSVLRPYFIKDNEHVFLWRFLKFFNKRRGHSDITMWIPTFVIEQKRLVDTWMDLAPTCVDFNDASYRNYLVSEHQRLTQASKATYDQLFWEYTHNPNNAFLPRDGQGNLIAPVWQPPDPLDPNLQANLDHYNSNFINPPHRQRFPIGEHLMAHITCEL